MSGNQRRVILFGDSLILEGLRASLAVCADMEVLTLEPSLDESLEALLAACPAAFIFDLGTVRPDFQLSLLHQPGLLLVGIDPKTYQALVWSGRQAATVVAADLIDVIRQTDPGLAGR